MRHHFISTVILVSTACGGGSTGTDDASVGPDASLGSDAGADAGFTALCDTASQVGCGPGMKCTWLTIPPAGRVTCVPDGTAAIGEACTQGTPGEATGYDDCARGGICKGSTCVQLCTNSPADTCDPDRVCNVVGPTPWCVPACNPVTQLDANYNDCPAGDGCYLSPDVGKGICKDVPDMAATQKQGDVCYASESWASCDLNGCAAGYGGLLVLGSGAPLLCGAFCTPANSYMGSPNSPTGIAPDDCSAARVGNSGLECRFIQSIYLLSPTPPAYGVCVDTARWGSCADFDPQGMVDAWNTAYTNAAGDPTAKHVAAQAAYCQYCFGDVSCQGTRAPQCKSVGCLDVATQAAFDAMYLGQ